jgi:rubrerythrin
MVASVGAHAPSALMSRAREGRDTSAARTEVEQYVRDRVAETSEPCLFVPEAAKYPLLAVPVAKLFEAASKAEAIHAANHRKVLEKLGETIAGPDLKPVDVKTTKDNLTDAIAGETHEFESMYPGFIAAAEAENNPDAKKSFTWALDTEKKHRDFYQAALDALNAGTPPAAPVPWYVCPVCGNTYDEATMKAACDFCGTKRSAFITV